MGPYQMEPLAAIALPSARNESNAGIVDERRMRHKHLYIAPPLISRVRGVDDARERKFGPCAVLQCWIITVSFLPIFSLGGKKGRMFGAVGLIPRHLQWPAKLAFLSVTLVPALMVVFVLEGGLFQSSKKPK